jgi:hypothetical protein
MYPTVRSAVPPPSLRIEPMQFGRACTPAPLWRPRSLETLKICCVKGPMAHREFRVVSSTVSICLPKVQSIAFS